MVVGAVDRGWGNIFDQTAGIPIHLGHCCQEETPVTLTSSEQGNLLNELFFNYELVTIV